MIGKYRNELRLLVRELIVGSANSGFFDLSDSVLGVARNINLFTKYELTKINYYLFVRKWKLYKFPILDKYVVNQLATLAQNIPSSIGKIVYQQQGAHQKVFTGHN